MLNYPARKECEFRIVTRTTEEEYHIVHPQKKWETPEKRKIKERNLEATARKDFLEGMTDEKLAELIKENGDVLI